MCGKERAGRRRQQTVMQSTTRSQDFLCVIQELPADALLLLCTVCLKGGGERLQTTTHGARSLSHANVTRSRRNNSNAASAGQNCYFSLIWITL